MTCKTAFHEMHAFHKVHTMQAEQEDENEVFHDSFQFQLPPPLALTVSSQVQTSSTPFSRYNENILKVQLHSPLPLQV